VVRERYEPLISLTILNILKTKIELGI